MSYAAWPDLCMCVLVCVLSNRCVYVVCDVWCGVVGFVLGVLFVCVVVLVRVFVFVLTVVVGWLSMCCVCGSMCNDVCTVL